MSAYETLELEMHDAIALLRLARPQRRNAISVQVSQDLGDALSALAEDDGVRATVLTGTDPAFCAGMDLKEAAEQAGGARQREGLALSTRYHLLLWRHPKPLVCAVNGPAIGGGVDLAALCDLRLASERATFAQPQLRFGVPALFTPLRFAVGDARARELCLTGRTVDAAEAERIGLVSRVVAHDELVPAALETAAGIAEAPAAAIAAAKTYMAGAPGRDFPEALRLEHDEPFAALFAAAEDAAGGGEIAARTANRLRTLAASDETPTHQTPTPQEDP